MQFGRDIGAEQIPIDAALARLERVHAQLDEIVLSPHPYGRWFVTGVLAVLAAAAAVLFGGGPGAAIATLVAVGLFVAVPYLPIELADLPPSLVVASGIVVLLAGLSLVGAAGDAISGFPVTAGGRTFEVVVLTLGIVVGIGGVLDLARRAGVDLVMIDAPFATTPVAVQVVCAAVIAGAWGLASYALPRAATAAAAAGGLAWLIYATALGLGVGPASSRSCPASRSTERCSRSSTSRRRASARAPSTCSAR